MRDIDFGGLRIAFDDRVLAPRPWTTMQAAWAAELLATAPPGPVLELGSGAGQIGLLAIGGSDPALGRTLDRTLVCVDTSAAACDYARRNAREAGLADRVEVRQRAFEDAADPGERFALVLADPPWVPSAETDRHPDDPPEAIDGGRDGLDVARACVQVAAAHLAEGGSVLLQLGSRAQADALAAELVELAADEVRQGEGGVVARLSAVASGGG